MNRGELRKRGALIKGLAGKSNNPGILQMQIIGVNHFTICYYIAVKMAQYQIAYNFMASIRCFLLKPFSRGCRGL
jgi:hypothetical protein